MVVTLLKREFTVSLPLQRAWDHLARIEHWPSWARHMKKIELQPHGELGPQSVGVIHLVNGMKVTFRMTEFITTPPRSWKWVGSFLWLKMIYDHRFEAVDSEHTKLTWIVEGSGFGVSVLGPMFAMIYRRDLDKAIPLLIAEMNASPPVTNLAAAGGACSRHVP